MAELGVIAGRFAVERAFRSGAMGAVFVARDQSTGAKVALKLLENRHPLLRERFFREAQVLAQLDHPRIVKYVAHGTTDRDALYLVMEWIEGETLRERLEQVGLSVGETLVMARGIADALAYAHAHGVVHRDLKPTNLIFAGGDIARVTLIDFGVARLEGQQRKLTEAGASVGTPGYMAPEQVRSHRDVDGRADLFALGCILYEALTGRRPFGGDDLVEVWMKIVLAQPPSTRTLRPELPEALHSLVHRLLAKEPEDRPVDARAVARELAAIEWLGDASRRPPVAVDELPTRILQPVAPASTPPGDRTIDTSDPTETLCLVLATEPAASHAGPETSARIEAMAREAGGQASFLADGSAALVFYGPGSLHDLARRGAQAALGLRALIPEAMVAVTLGVEQGAGVPLMEDAIARGLKLIEGALLDAIATGESGAAPISLDEATARLVSDRFEVRPTVSGYQLIGAAGVARTG